MMSSWCSRLRRCVVVVVVAIAAVGGTTAILVAQSPAAAAKTATQNKKSVKGKAKSRRKKKKPATCTSTKHRKTKSKKKSKSKKQTARKSSAPSARTASTTASKSENAKKKKKKGKKQPPKCTRKHKKKPKPKKPTSGSSPSPSPSPTGGSAPPGPIPVVDLPCNVTLSPGANVASAIQSTPNGEAICLSTGTYPEININGANHASYVTIEPAPQASPTVQGIQISNSSFLRFQQLSLTAGINMIKTGSNFQFLDNNIGPATYGIALDGSPNPTTNVAIQGNSIHDLDFSGSSAGYAGGQGVTLYDGGDVVVNYNTFWANSWHYIQCGGCDGLTVDHNLFRCPCNEHSGAHLNILQIWQGGANDSFTNNIVNGQGGPTEICGGCILLENGAGGQTCSDRFTNPNVSNNLFIDPGGSLPVQVNLNDGGVFENNTIVGGQYGTAFGNGASPACANGTDTNMTVSHNIEVGDTSSGSNLWMGNCSGSCVFDYNVTGDTSAHADGSTHYVTNWKGSWVAGSTYQPSGLPFAAGYQGGIGP